MVQKKAWYQSKTIWGIVIALAGFILNKYGVQLPTAPAPNADFTTLQTYIDQVQQAKGSITTIISVVMAAVGTILGIIGRVKADSQIA